MITFFSKIIAFILSTSICSLLAYSQIQPFDFYDNPTESILKVVYQSFIFYLFIFIPISLILDNIVIWSIYRFKRFNKIRKFEVVALNSSIYILFILLFQFSFAIYYSLIGVTYFQFSYPLLISIIIFSFVSFILNAFTRKQQNNNRSFLG
jgi:hypothetical protein